MGSTAGARGAEMKPKTRLKRGQRGWFAAGAGCERALGELSAAACKVCVHVCLTAARADGCLEFERDGLAKQLRKSRSTLGRCLRELAAKRVCEWEAAPNQYRRSRLRVCPQYWPYEVAEQAAGQQAVAQSPSVDASAYVAAVRKMFRAPACVQGRFGPDDERLAADWQRAGVSLTTVQRAILLGSVRKSMSLLDRPGGEPVRSLRYFASLLQEVRTESFPPSYWQHLEFNLRRCERLEQVRRAEAAESACPDLAQPEPSEVVHRPTAPATAEASKETG